MFFLENDTWTKINHCPQMIGHVMHDKMLLRAKQFNKQLVCCTLLKTVVCIYFTFAISGTGIIQFAQKTHGLRQF